MNDEEDIYDFNDEEFDLSDVVDSKTDDQIKEELDKRVSFNRKKAENSKSNDDEEENMYVSDYQQNLSESFQDFLVLKDFSGSSVSHSDSSRIPFELLKNSGRTIQIDDDPAFLEKHALDNSTILLHRDENNYINRIEVVCSCGERTVIDIELEQ